MAALCNRHIRECVADDYAADEVTLGRILMQKRLVTEWREMYTETAHAPSWLEAHRWAYGPHVAQAIASDVRRKLELRPDDRLLEVGAGSGAFLMSVLDKNQHGVGLDFCEPLIRQGGRLGVDSTRVKLGVAEGIHLPVLSESFDKVLCYSVAHHFPDDAYARGVIHQLIRVCRVGGIVLLGDVCGVMERYRRSLVRRGVPPVAAEAVLSALTPVRYLRWMRARRKIPRWCRSYRRKFFDRTLKGLPCEFEILEQDIPGRNESLGRFDVRIYKKSPLRNLAVAALVSLWTSTEWFTVAFQELGPIIYG